MFAYFCVYELKGLSLEQIDRCIEESTPRTSANWRPHSTFAADMGYVKLCCVLMRRRTNNDNSMTEFGVLEERVISDKERKGDV